SDCGAIRDIYAFHKVVNTSEEAASIGIRRGCDLNCGNVYQSSLMEAVAQGLIDEGEIDLAVYRLMLARMKLGMFDAPETVPYAQIPFAVNDSEAHSEMALKMAHESMTLLKNDGILPLNLNKIRNIAVVGPNANSVDALKANYFGDASHPVTLLEGIKKAVGKKGKVYYHEGCPIVEHDDRSMRHQIIETKYLSTLNKDGEWVPGLTGSYYKGIGLEGEPVLTRIDPILRMFWREGSPTDTDVAQGLLTPEQQVEKDHFSVRWSGRLTPPESGWYDLGVVSDDGCRIFLDGKKIAEDWTEHEMLPCITRVELEKDQNYDLVIEYFETTGDAGIWLVWNKISEEETQPKGPFEPSEEMLAQVRKADVVVFAGGLDANWEGEEMRGRRGVVGFNGGDRTLIELPEAQMKTLKALKETGTPVVCVLLAGSAVSFDGLEKEIPAILMGWYPGQRGGDALADVLFGRYNPAGRLPVTFYSSTQELPDFRDYNMRAGKGFTYRYYQGEPLFPFGHGLSYTTFWYSNLEADCDTFCGGTMTVSLDVENTGGTYGKEIVQIYVKNPACNYLRAEKELKGFTKCALGPGEKKTVRIFYNRFCAAASRDSSFFVPGHIPMSIVLRR
ncbi:MAG TPA: glycoside hydrolase family 3 C-terminal domain-containing protein, partial [Prolixibacteraceae bacterium]|nr:glycoside hydrolase family 3 C-terminal domain-containing protein [Prolixibacteraceae bacterium]